MMNYDYCMVTIVVIHGDNLVKPGITIGKP